MTLSGTGHVGTVYGLAVIEKPSDVQLVSASYDKTLRVGARACVSGWVRACACVLPLSVYTYMHLCTSVVIVHYFMLHVHACGFEVYDLCYKMLA